MVFSSAVETEVMSSTRRQVFIVLTVLALAMPFNCLIPPSPGFNVPVFFCACLLWFLCIAISYQHLFSQISECSELAILLGELIF